MPSAFRSLCRVISVAVMLVFALVFAACSSPTPATSNFVADAKADVKATDATPKGDGADAGGTDAEDVESLPDEAEDVAEEDTPEPDIDWSELLDNEDVGASPDVGPTPTGPVGQLYAHTKDTLYQLDLTAKAFVEIGKFKFDKSPDLVTDIAVDAVGKLYSVTYHDVFVCDIKSAACTWLAKLQGTGTFNGLTFVPKGAVNPNAESLIGISDTGAWNLVQPSGGTAKITKLGQYGGKWLSSGDSFSVEGIGTYATLKGQGSSDSLALVDPKNGKLIQVIGETGAKGLYGLAWWAGVFYAFSSDGNVYTLDVATGKATPVKGITLPAGAKWWGAGVSTRANAQ